MLTTISTFVSHERPSPRLAGLVSEYVYRSVCVPNGMQVVRDVPFRVTSSIDFYLGEVFTTEDVHSGRELPFGRCSIRGPRTYTKNRIRIEGNFASFSVRFRPVGLYGLLGVSAYEFRDESIDGSAVLPVFFAEITGRLSACRDIRSCVEVIEPYLLRLAEVNEQRLRLSAPVSELAGIITGSKAPVSVGELADHVYLSRRQLERNFTREVGTPPKLFSRMVRFSNLLAYRKKYPAIKWASLAYEFLYADQMHLVKDFREFLGVAPSSFQPDNFAF